MLHLIQICILFSILPSYYLYPPPPSIWQLQEEANCLATCGHDDDSYSDKGNEQLAGYDKGAKKLIAMGFPAPLHTHPWVVAIDVTIECSGLNGTKKNFRCTGAIIDQRYVLSSAHCFHIMTDDLPSGCWMNSHSIVFPKFFKVSAEAVKIFAKQNLNTTTEDDVYEIEDWEAHPEFNTDLLPGTDGALKADMAILRLKQKKQFKLGNTNLRKICLPTTALTNEMGPGRLFMMAGFGRTLNESDSTKTQSRISNELREVTLQMGDRKYCNSNDAMVSIHPPYRLFCGSRRERGGLKGDSGAPAMVVSPSNGKWFLLGVFSQIKTYSELKNTQPDYFSTWDDLACNFLKSYTGGKVKCQVYEKGLDGYCREILLERKLRLNHEL